MTIGQIIKEQRIQQGKTQAAVASDADVSTSSITRVENDQPVDRRVVARICIALGTTLAEVEKKATAK